MDKLIPISEPSITSREIDLVTDALRSGWVSSIGKYIETFEREFAGFCGAKYGIATSNATTGLHLALVAYGIGPGDEVIIPDLTFVATANTVRHTGATPVMVDIDRETLCIDPECIRRAITKKTKAIMPVHLYGHPADMTEINKIAQKHGLKVIEDAAEAHGAEVNGAKVGSLGDCGVFSFYGNKIMTCGEGGMITTNDPAFYKRAIHLRDHAMSPSKRYWHDEVGYNYRLTNLQAAMAVAQLQRVNELLDAKANLFRKYEKLLSVNPRIKVNRTSAWAKNVYWMVCVEVEGLNESSRQELMRQLKLKGIDSRPYFYPVSDMPMYQQADTPVAHELSKIGLNLPSFFGLKEDQVEGICREFLKLV